MLETAELLAFSKTVDAKSLTRAAAELRVPRATLGRRLSRLEEKLGVRLLKRTTRSLSLTDAGQKLYRHARIVLDAAQEAEASVRRDEQTVRGDLRVSVSHLGGELRDIIADFVAAHPMVRLQVQVTSRLVDLRREGYDVAIRATGKLEPGLFARRLTRSALIAVASPAYLAARGTPRTLRDLQTHQCLMGFARGELPQTHWPTARGSVHLEGALFSNDLGLLCRLAVRGLGIALVPESLVAERIARGELCVVMPTLLRSEGSISIVHVERELTSPPVRAFVDWIVGRMGARGTRKKR